MERNTRSKIGRDAKGEINFQPNQGFSSFDLKPDDFLPLARGGYVIRFEAGSNIEISKPLMQSKDLELFDRFSQIALNVPGSYDIVKLGDMILRDYDKNPDDYKPATATGDNTAEQLQMLLQLAQMENQMMMSGKDVPATPFASPAHTRVHLTFMNAGGPPGQPPQGAAPMNGNPGPMNAAAGVTNKPNGMAQPGASMANIMPALQTGGNKQAP